MTDTIPNETKETPAATPAPAPEAWYNAIQDPELKGFAETKGWKDQSEVIKSYKNIEQFVGADKAGRGIVIPKEDSAPEEWNAYYSKLGRPETPDAYKLPVPDGASPEFSQHISKIMHETGLSQSQATKLATGWNDYQTKQAQAHEEQQIALENQQVEALKKEWGGNYDANIEVARNAVRQFGIDGDKIDALQKAMGYDGALKFAHELAKKIGEDKFVGGDTNKSPLLGTMTKEQAETEYRRVIQDKDFYDKYQKNDPEALAIMDNIWKHR